MTTKRDISDPTTDQDDLIIDTETVTQWVDHALSVPHTASVDSLAAKFPCLREYGEDAEQIRSLTQKAFTPDIKAPAHTLAHVLKAIREEQGPANADDSPTLTEEPKGGPSSHQQEEDTSTTDIAEAPFILEFPPEKKQKMPYLWPIAALIFLMALVGSIIHHEHNRDMESAIVSTPEKDTSPVKKSRKAIMMSSETDHHSPENRKTHLTNYNLSPQDNHADSNDEKKKEEEKKKDDKKSSPPSPQN